MLLVPPDLARRTGPDRRTAVRNVLLLALAPGIVLWLAISALGKLFTGPLKSWNHSESDLNRSLQDTRTQTWDSVTAIWSHIGNTEIIIGVALAAVALVFWHKTVVVRRHPRHRDQPAGGRLCRRDPGHRSPTSGRPTPGPSATDLQLPERSRRRERGALRLVCHHGHDDRAVVAAPNRDRGVLGDPHPGRIRPPVPRHAPPQ